MSTTTPPAPRTTNKPRDSFRRVRTSLILLAGVSLLAGLNAGLVRLDVWAPVESVRVGDLHGAIMVFGFMASLIALERAQALRSTLAYLAPLLLQIGSLVLIVGLPPMLGKLLLFDGAIAFVAVMIALWARAPLALVATQVLASVLLMVGAGLWVAVDLPAVLPLLVAFLVVTIASERAELAQLTMGNRAIPTLLVAATAAAVAACLSLFHPSWGSRAIGLTCLLIALWLTRDDVGRRMIRADGLRRFNAAALLSGNAWLAVAGVVWIIVGEPITVGTYDTVVHGVFLGFGMSMIMAHAPIIFPTVLGRTLRYRPVMWVPLILLHFGLAARVTGALTQQIPLYTFGGSLTVIAVLTFAASVVYSVVKK